LPGNLHQAKKDGKGTSAFYPERTIGNYKKKKGALPQKRKNRLATGAKGGGGGSVEGRKPREPWLTSIPVGKEAANPF